MTVVVYKSTDASAPTLSGTVGDLTNLLKKCLVDGYGAKAAAGWTSPFVGTANQRVFRPGGGVQHYFAVDDDGPDATALAKEAQLRGFETMSAWATGTGLFPTVAQQAASGVVIRKSTAVSATVRSWIVIADDRTCVLFIISGDVAGSYTATYFGEFYSLLTVADAYRSMIIGRSIANVGGMAIPNEQTDVVVSASGTANTPGHYVTRTYTGLGTAQAFRKWSDFPRCNGATILGKDGAAVPEPVTGAIHVAPIHLSEGGIVMVRGRMRGLYNICHPIGAFTDGDTITGSGAYAGRTFLVIKQSGNVGLYCVDITGAWEVN